MKNKSYRKVILQLFCIAVTVVLCHSCKHTEVPCNFIVEAVEMQRIEVEGLNASNGRNLDSTAFYMVNISLKDGDRVSWNESDTLFQIGIKDTIKSIEILNADGHDICKSIEGVNTYKKLPYDLLFVEDKPLGFGHACSQTKDIKTFVKTINRMRMDVNAEYYVEVKNDINEYEYPAIFSCNKSISLPKMLIIKLNSGIVKCHVNNTPLKMASECVVPYDANDKCDFFKKQYKTRFL